MSFLSDYKAALKKLQEEEAPTKKSSSGTKSTKTSKSAGTKSTTKKTVAPKPKKKSFMDEYEEEKERLLAQQEEKETVQSRMTVGSIAPVKDEEEDRKWFEKGAFEDGYQFGDVSKTILGTLSDVGENLTAGVLGMGEKIIDAAAYLAPAFNVSQQVQNNPTYAFDIEDYRQQQEDVKKFISKDLYDEEKVAHTLVSGYTYPARQTIGYSTDDSVLGEKSDALAQSGGQLLGTLGLQAVGVPWWVTSGVTTFGSEAENAFNQGATYEQAGASAAISAGAEILTEKLFGGSGLGEEGLINLDPLTRGISNKLVKTLADYGLDIAAEGSEEVVSEIAGKLGSSLYREERLKDILLSEEAFQDYLDSFIGGGVLGGVMNSAKFVSSVRNKTDYRAELTQNEQKVVDKVYEERLAELKENGKVTAKQKSELYEAVQRDMEKGYISTETIEEVLGDKDYQLYKETVDKEDAILREFEELGNKQNPTLAESHRYAELQRQVADIRQYSSREALRQRLNESVYQKAQGDRLVESYNERARRGKKFEADVTKYDSKMRETVQRAIDSGTLNNTNRTHELVDFIAKISADKGVLFDFTNNEKIKGTRFAVDGKIVNGYKTDSGITLNVESPKYLQSTVGHEITHVLEGTEFYDALKTTVFNYAKSKGVYDTRLAEVTEIYKNIEGADVEGELTADLVGDYLFQDSNYVSKLSTENRNVFQKIYDEIKYLYKVATAGSKEARELEKVKRAFDKAYRDSSKAKTDTQYSLSDSTGKELSKEQAEYFKDSKARDDNGNLKLVYHSSPTAGFTVFDGGEGHGNYKFGDYADAVTFFTDNKAMADSYSPSSEKVDTTKLNNLVEAKEWLDTIGVADLEIRQDGTDYVLFDNDEGSFTVFESEEHILRDLKRTVQEQYGDSFAGGQYEGYLNLTNPLVVDAEGRPWDSVTEEFSQEIYDKFQSLTAEEKEVLKDLAEWGEYGVFVSEIRKAVENPSVSDAYARPLASAFNKLKDDTGYVNLYNLYDVTHADFSDKAIRESAIVTLSTNDYVERALKDGSYDGVIIKNVIDYGGHAHATRQSPPGNDYIVFNSNQFKAADNVKPTEDADIRYSLSEQGETPKRYGDFATTGKDVALEISTVPEKTQLPAENSTGEILPDNVPPVETELERLTQEQAELENRMTAMGEVNDYTDFESVNERYLNVLARIAELQESETERVDSFTDEDAPLFEESTPEVAPVTVDDPFKNRDWFKIGNQKHKAFIHENPEFKEIFQLEANIMLGELQNSTKGRKLYNDALYYRSGGEEGWSGQKRQTSESIAYLIDAGGMTYERIENGLKAIIKGDGAENNADSKHIEFVINDRLLNGYNEFFTDERIPPNQDYINLVNQWQTTKHDQESSATLTDADAPMEVGPVLNPATPDDYAPMISKEHGVPEGQTTMFSDIREAVRESVKDTGTRAKVLTEEPDVKRKKFKAWDWVKEHILDNGMVFEDLAKESGNRALEEKWNFIRNSRDMAQHLIGKGNERVKSLNSIRKVVEDSGKVKQFYDYMYHKHNIARMSLAERNFGDNKAVFGDYVTWEESFDVANRYEAENPEFKNWAEDVYGYMNYLRDLLVEGGVISQDTADLWAEMYPHYVPIRRDGFSDMDIVVPLDSKRTGANNPVKRAKGGNQDILPMFDTIAMRTLQTYRAIARNQFGVELKNTLGTTIEHDFSSLEEYLQMLETEDSLETLLKKGEKGENPTFTVFEDGQKVEFEITDEIYEALKPKSPASQWRAPIVSAWSDLFRKLTTEYNPTFILTNPIKDVQDIILNSQHPIKTYADIPRSIWQQVSNGTYYKEYLENGGESYSYFDNDTNTFVEDSKLIEALKLPLKPISFLNNHIEMTPRLAEYIASREAGKSIEGAMLDAARVTTNFAAGGDWAKFANRNGVPFFNASVQGAIQQVRNVREAHHKGLMGYVGLATRFAMAGLPALILNNALWDEDEDYEKLADYVKQDYYIVAKYDDGKFFRIPKGRAVSVIQNAMEQVQNAITGDDEVDLGNFLKLAAANIAPNNPVENNIVAPIFQVFANKTWYDEELVPSRLQDLPAIEQHDEKTDQFSVWFAEKMNEISGGKVNISPKQMTYLLNQYSGGVGDFLLPMVTPKAESGDDSFVGQMLAPFRDKFTTDSVINNQTTTDFRDLQDSLKVTANSKNATQEDMFRSMYIDSISYELNDLYAQKREIQTSGRADSVKCRLAREIQEQINEIMEHALSTYNDVSIDGKYATVSDRRYNYDAEKDTWYQIKEKNADGSDNYYYQKEQEVTKAFEISYSDYWNDREAYDDAYWFATAYDKNIVNTAKLVFGVDDFVSYANEMKDINGKDKDGNSVNGLKKERIIDYCNNLTATYGEKIILFKSQYPKDDTYNYDIIDYLNSRDDISYREMKTILEELGFEVDAKGNITWD